MVNGGYGCITHDDLDIIMKIAFVVSGFPRLSETFVLNQITGLIDLGCVVDIYARKLPADERIHDQVKKYDLLSRTFYFNDLFEFFKIPPDEATAASKKQLMSGTQEYLRSERGRPGFNGLRSNRRRYDAIIGHFGPNGYAALTLKDCGIIDGPIFVFFHGYDMSHVYHLRGDAFYDQLYAKSRLFLPTTDFWMDKFIAMGYAPAKLKTHRMGVDCRQFKLKIRRSGKNITIVSISRLVEKKGLEYSIQAVGGLLKECDHLNYKIIGEGPLKGRLQDLIDRLGAGSRIKLLGEKTQQEIHGELKSSDILLAPSVTAADGNMEGIPVVIMEAMASSLPVIATAHSGIPELVINNKSGFLVPEKSIVALKDKLKTLIHDPALRRKMGAAGRKIVLDRHDIDKLNKQLLTTLRKHL